MFQWLKKRKEKRIYLDYAAATPVRAEVLAAMMPFFSERFANAGGVHEEGRFSKQAIEKARGELATTLRIRPAGIVFTGSGTESNNLALLGIIEKKRKEGRAYSDMEVVTSAIEHASILSVCEHLESLGVVVKYVGAKDEGIISLQEFESALTPKTDIVAVGYVNSEIGVIQPVTKLSRIVRAKEKEFGTHIHMHVDAAQAPLWLPCALDALLCDSLALDAGKCYGPKGVGVLAMRNNVALEPFIFGGGQESGLRAGTENTPLIVGAVKAIVVAQAHYKERSERVAKLRDTFFTLITAIDGVLVNGSREARVANNVHVSVEGVESEFAVVSLSLKGIDAATKSACGGAKGDGSAVVRHIYADQARALTTIRFTLGEETTLEEVEKTAILLTEHIRKTREMNKKLTQT
jgi:cysteine desulfurase